MKKLWILMISISVLLLAACARQGTVSVPPTAFPTPRESTLAAPTASPTASPTAEDLPTQVPTEAPPATPEATLEPTPTVPAPTEAAPTAETTSAETPTACVNKAGYFGDVTIPDDTSFKQNLPFTKTWKVRNEGDCVWEGYKLVFAGGETMDGAFANPIPAIQPNEVKDISIDLTSPPQGGIFTGLWELESADGQRFGFNSSGKDLIWVRISVSWYPDGGGGAHQPVVAGCSSDINQGFEAQLLALINDARVKEGLAALVLDPKLTSAARVQSTDMACFGIRDHIGSDGSNWFQRIEAQGYKYSYASENIYYGDPNFGADAAGTFDWWMNSPVHRNNILSKKITQIGIGHVSVSGGDGWGYSTLVFARP